MKTLTKALFAIFALVAVALPGAVATSESSFDGTTICRENGQRYDVASWTWSGTAWVKEYERPSFHTEVTGSTASADWTSNKEVRTAFAVTESGAIVIAEKARDGSATGPGLTAIVLCSRGSSGHSNKNLVSENSDSQSDTQGDTEVPEFSSILAIGTIGLLGVGLVASKRA